MVNYLVERATSDALVGPDWAKNTEVCEILNHNPGQVKDVVKGIKKKLKSKHAKVQILALTLLECMLKNCGDIVHMHVADRNILPQMVKIYKKKSDNGVKEKILILVDTWQEEFGGARAIHPHYFVAYQELLRAGAVFPLRTERPQAQPANPQNIQNSDDQQEVDDPSGEPEFPTLSLTEIQNAQSIMNTLAVMLNTLHPTDKEELEQDAIIDLVEQCRVYKQRVLHLVNSTSDESLLRQGLELNDDLQRLLSKHQAIASGIFSANKTGIDDEPLVDTGDICEQFNERSFSGAAASCQPGYTAPAAASPQIDLFSCDDFNSPQADNSLATAPFGEPQQTSPAPQQEAFVPNHMFSDDNNAYGSSNTQGFAGQTNPWAPQFQQQEQQNFHGNMGPTWNSQLDQQQRSLSPVYDHQSSGVQALPPPPWEVQPEDTSPVPSAQYPQSMVGMYIQPNTTGNFSTINNNRAVQGNQFASFHHQQSHGAEYMVMVPHQMAPYNQQAHQMYGNPQMGALPVYGQQQYLDQQMHGLSIRDDNGLSNSPFQVSSYSYAPPVEPSKPEEMFGDLVDMEKVKPTNTPRTPGTM
ncbi:TOM1-LIKE 8 [Hibiscus trionum]|uniref:TOM1-LIKE 8 n=1 Tax=Hibiscus trionum TaxID=183268 RepID=A0A9W7J9G4_HIBTR|nr:TOM1-LIKE 8 [Hibiscus trionum]